MTGPDRTTDADADARRPFGVLMVCHANVCRSPLAAALLHERAAATGLPWVVSSAGTHARSATSVSPLVGAVLGEFSVRPLTLQSQPLTGELLAAADLVLTADTANRQAVVAAHVSALRKTFTLLQFARLCSVVSLDGDAADVSPAELGPALLRGAVAARGRVQPGLRGHDDVADPMGRDIGHFRDARDVIARAVQDIMRPVEAVTGRAELDA